MMQANARIGLGRGAPIRRPRSIVIFNPLSQQERPFLRSQERTYSNDGKPKSRALPDLKNFLKAASSEPQERTVEDLDGHEEQDGSKSFSSFESRAPLGMGRGSLLKQSSLFSEDIQRRKEELETRRRTDMEDIFFGEGEEEEGPDLDLDEIYQHVNEVSESDLKALKSINYYDEENPLYDEDPDEVQETFLEDIEEAENIEGKAFDDYEGIFDLDLPDEDEYGDKDEERRLREYLAEYDDDFDGYGYTAGHRRNYYDEYDDDLEENLEENLDDLEEDLEENLEDYAEDDVKELNLVDDDYFFKDDEKVKFVDEDITSYERGSRLDEGIRIDEEGNFFDKEGNRVDEEDLVYEDGKLFDEEGNLVDEKVIRLDEEGNHFDEEGNLIDKEGNIIVDQDVIHRLVGKQEVIYFDEEGDLVDEEGNFKGYFDEEGNLVDEKGNFVEDKEEKSVLVEDDEGNLTAYTLEEEPKYYTIPEVELKFDAQEGSNLFTKREPQELEEGEGEEEYFLGDEIYDEEGNAYLEGENDFEEDEKEYYPGKEDGFDLEEFLGNEDEGLEIDEDGEELVDEEEGEERIDFDAIMKKQLDKLLEETEEQEIERETNEKVEIGEMLKDNDAYEDLLLTPTFHLRNQTVADNLVDTMKIGEPLEDLEGAEEKVEMKNIIDGIESLKEDTTEALAEIGKDFDTDHAFQQVKVAEFKEKMKGVWKIRAKKAKERRAKREARPNVIPPQHLEGFGIHFPELFQQIPQDHKYLPELERAARVLSKNGVYTHQEKYKMMQTIISTTMEMPVPDDFIPGQTLDRVSAPKPIIEEESYYFQDEEDEFLRPPERTY